MVITDKESANMSDYQDDSWQDEFFPAGEPLPDDLFDDVPEYEVPIDLYQDQGMYDGE